MNVQRVLYARYVQSLSSENLHMHAVWLGRCRALCGVIVQEPTPLTTKWEDAISPCGTCTRIAREDK